MATRSEGEGARRVIPGGQEERVRAMVSPALPEGWAFSSAVVDGDEVRARYANGDAEAALRLRHHEAGEGARVADFSLELAASEGAPAVEALRDALSASVAAHAEGFAWVVVSPAQPAPTSTPWTVDRPTPSPAEPPSALAAALGRLAPLAVEPAPAALTDALRRLRDGEYDPALAELSAFAGDAAGAEALAARALRFEALRRLGRYHEALVALDDALARDPGAVELHLAAASLHAELHDELRAAHHAREALRLDAASPSVALRAAPVLLASGARDEALAARDLAASLASGASPALLRDLAAFSLEADDFDAAAALYERSLEADPNSVDALVALGHLSAWRGDAAAARARAEAALAVEPESPAALCLRGATAMIEGRATEARADLDRAARFDPSDGVAAVWRGEALLREGRYDEAARETRRGGERSDDLANHVAAQLVLSLAQLRGGAFPGMPEHVLKPALSTLEREAAPAEHAFAFTPTRDLEALLEDALAALRGNRSPRATYVRRDGSLAALAVPPSPRLASKRALWKLVATGAPGVALAALDAVAAAHPKAAEPFNYRGEVWLYLGRAADARAEFERALARYDRSRWAYIGLGAAAVLDGHYDRALAHLDEGARRSGAHGPTAYVYRGEALRNLGRLDEALADLDYAVEQHPLRVGAWVNLALARRAAGDDEGALAAYTALRARAPGFAYDACRALGRDVSVSDPAAVEAVAAEMLSMLRGNRGASCVTYFTRAGELRCVPAVNELSGAAAP